MISETITTRKIARGYFRTTEVAKYLGIGLCSVYELIKSGKLRACRFSSRRISISRESLEAFLAESAIVPESV